MITMMLWLPKSGAGFPRSGWTGAGAAPGLSGFAATIFASGAFATAAAFAAGCAGACTRDAAQFASHRIAAPVVQCH